MNRALGKSIVAICIAFYALISSYAWAGPNPAHTSEFRLSPEQKAEFLLNRQQYEKALSAYKSLLKERNEDSYVFRGLVRAYEGLHRLKEVEGFIKDYLSSYSSSSAGQYGLGYYYYLQGDDPKAQEQFEKAIGLDEQNVLAWNNWGASLSRTKSYTYAVEKVKQAIRRNPGNPMFYNNLSMIYDAMGEPGLFFAEYRQYVRDGPNLVAQAYGRVIAKTLRQEAFRFFSQGNLDEAIKKFSETARIYKEIDHKPGLVPIYFGLGILYEEKGDVKIAQTFFKKVLAINPDHLQAREKVK